MRECCANCRHRYKLTKLDYSRGGCEHTDVEGFVCMAFSDEGKAEWLVGVHEDSDMCECYLPKEKPK